MLDVPVNFGCDIPKVEPQNIYYPPNGRNKVTVTFDQDIQVGQEGSFTCGVRDITTPFVVAANRSFVFDCPEGTENYPDGEQSYAAVATIRVKPGELPAYCSNTTYVWAAQGQTPTPTPTPTPTSTVRPTGGPTTYPSDVSFLSASCPTSLVLSNETSVNAFLVIKGQPTCPDSGAPVPGGGVWKFFVTRPSGQKLQEFAPFSCAQGTTVFTLATDAEGAYVIDITADTDALPPEQRVGELSSSCNFRVFRRPPSKFPELPLAFVALIFVALFVYLSRYSRYSEKRSKKPE